jgi:hypothetical protein
MSFPRLMMKMKSKISSKIVRKTHTQTFCMENKNFGFNGQMSTNEIFMLCRMITLNICSKILEVL